MKKLISLISAASLALGMSTAVFAADIQVTVEGTPVAWTDAKPFIDENDRTLVPLRSIANALGLEVAWNDDTNTAAFTDGEQTMEFTIGSSEMHGFLNDADFHIYLEMDTTPVIKDSRIYAPARYLAEAFQYTVDWDQAAQTVTIAKGETPVEDPVQLPEATAGEPAAILPVTAEAGSYGKTYIAFHGVTLVEEPDIFEYSIDAETTLNGLGYDYGFVTEEGYVEMNLGAALATPPGVYPVTFTIPSGFFADTEEDIVVSTTLTVTTPRLETIMTTILADLEYGLWVNEGSNMDDVIDTLTEETDGRLEDSPFMLTVTDGNFVNDSEGDIEGFSCTLTLTNIETNETFSVNDTLISLYFISEEE